MKPEPQPQRSEHGDYCWCDECALHRKGGDAQCPTTKLQGQPEQIAGCNAAPTVQPVGAATDDKQWTPEYVGDLMLKCQLVDSGDVRKVIADAHNAALAEVRNPLVDALEWYASGTLMTKVAKDALAKIKSDARKNRASDETLPQE